jgi:rubrerythrin
MAGARDQLLSLLTQNAQPAQAFDPYATSAQAIGQAQSYQPTASNGANFGAGLLQGLGVGFFSGMSQQRQQDIQKDRYEQGIRTLALIDDYDQKRELDTFRQKEEIKQANQPFKVTALGEGFGLQQAPDGSTKLIDALGMTNQASTPSNQVQGLTERNITAEPQGLTQDNVGSPGQVAEGTQSIAEPTRSYWEALEDERLRQRRVPANRRAIQSAEFGKEANKAYNSILVLKAQQDKLKKAVDPETGANDTGGPWLLGDVRRGFTDLFSGIDQPSKDSMNARSELKAAQAEIRAGLKESKGFTGTMLDTEAGVKMFTENLPSIDATPEENRRRYKAFEQTLDESIRKFETYTGQPFNREIFNKVAPPPTREGVGPQSSNETDPAKRLVAALSPAVMQTESSGNPNATSPKGAMGLYQVMPTTYAEVAPKIGLPLDGAYDPENSRAAGEFYLEEQARKYDNNPVLALAAYNYGPGNVDREVLAKSKVLKEKPVSEVTYEDIKQYLPKETKNYVQKVLGLLGPQEAQAEELPTAQPVQVQGGGTVVDLREGSAPLSAEEQALRLQQNQAQPEAVAPVVQAEAPTPGVLGLLGRGASAVGETIKSIPSGLKAIASDPAGAASAAMDGLSFGWADEILDASGLGSAQYKEDAARFQKENPGTSVAMGIAGGLINPVSRLYKGASLLKSVALGSVEGAAYGAGSADTSKGENRVVGGIKGGAAGLAVGGVVGGGLKLAQKGAKVTKLLSDKSGLTDAVVPRVRALAEDESGAVGKVVRKANPITKLEKELGGTATARQAASTLKNRAGVSLAEAKKARTELERASKLGATQVNLADVLIDKGNNAATKTQRSLANADPELSQGISQKLTRRQELTTRRVEKAIDEAIPRATKTQTLKSGKTVIAKRDEVELAGAVRGRIKEVLRADKVAREGAAEPVYKTLYKRVPDIDPKKAMNKGNKVIDNAYSEIEKLHKFKPFRKAVNRARELVDDGPLGAGEIETRTKVLVKARKMIDEVSSEYTSGMGKTNSPELAGKLGTYRYRLDQALATVATGKTSGKSVLKAADKLFQEKGTLKSFDHRAQLQKVLTGNEPEKYIPQLFKSSPSELRILMEQLTPEGKRDIAEAFGVGLKQYFTSNSDLGNFAKIVRAKDFRQKVVTVLGKEQGSKLIRKLGLEDVMTKGKNAANAGSTTAGNLEQEAKNKVIQAGGAIVDMANIGSLQAKVSLGAKAAGLMGKIADSGGLQGLKKTSEALFDQEKGKKLLDYYIMTTEKQLAKTARNNKGIAKASRVVARETGRRK